MKKHFELAMSDEPLKSLSDDATFDNAANRPGRSSISLGDERTVGGDAGSIDTLIDGLEVVDLEARYAIEGTLGQGGMGAVLLATDTRLGRKVAIKRILGEAAGNKTAVARFLTEAKAIAALNHPNIVQIYDYGRAKDGPFLIMEYVDGGSLAERCRDSAIPLDEAIDLACHVCDGLAKAHDGGIVHRDIKPANILLTKENIPKLTDFGLAKAEAVSHGHTITGTGAVMGTPDFMPPEQRRDAAEVDHRSDLWSLAATVYQMVTGRSPRIIRFNDIPPALQGVLGKALEDRKDSRYQSAREFRDALRTSVRVATAVVAGEVIEGRCPACGVQNDPSRKFCKGCAGSLIAPCLKCGDANPIWDEICGSCGARQSPLLESRRGEMAAKQAEAEGLLGDCDFAGAAAVAAQLREESHPKLGQLTEWADSFLEQVEQSRAEQVRQAVEAMVEAGKHEAAHDYLSAIFAIEGMPRVMQDSVLPGMREPASEMLVRLKRTQAEADRLEKHVRGRIAAKSLDDLLPDVEKLLSLRPDRADVRKLRSQLVERRQKQNAARDQALASARASLERHEYEEAVRVLGTIAATTVTPDVANLRKQAEGLLAEARSLSGRIREAVAAKRLDGLLPVVERYLAMKPGDAEVGKLRQALVDREAKIVADVMARLEEAEKLGQACRFQEAAKSLAGIPESRRNVLVDACLDRMTRLATMRQKAMAAIAAASPGAYDHAIARGQEYEDACAAAKIGDAEFADLLAKTRAAHGEEERAQKLARAGEERAREFAALVRLAAGAALAVFVLGVAGLWIRSKVRAWSLASAIEQERWDDVLAIDPDDATALVGRARRKLSATPPDLSGAAADADRAAATGRLSLHRRAALSPVKGDIEAARACEHVRQGRLDDANRALLDARDGYASPQWLAKAGALIQQAWLSRAEEAVTKRDLMRLKLAISGARSAGVAVEVLTPLQVAGLVVEASGVFGRGDEAKGTAMASSALEMDVFAAAQILKLPEQSPLAERLLSDCRARFWSKVDVAEWKDAVKIATSAAAFAPAADGWLPEALTAERVERMVRDARLGDIPARLFAELSQSTLAGLSPETIAALPALKNSVGMELKLLPAGTFTMGHPKFVGLEPHPVTLTRPFSMGVHEVTRTQWERVMGTLPPGKQEDDIPMTGVSWDDAVAFCATLSGLPAEKSAGRVYRLPTEAEWEYACRAGTTTDYGFGDDRSRLGEFAWYRENSKNEVHPVGTRKPNAWGLFDMHGNAQEWCGDWCADYVPDRATTDPTGPQTGRERVSRGGCHHFPQESCASHSRNSADPTVKFSATGFRCVLIRAGKEETVTASAVVAGGGRPVPGTPLPGGGGKQSAESFKWSSIISENTLVNEITGLSKTAASAVASASEFKRGGYDTARQAFSTVAVAFCVIAEYDEDIRWKKEAEEARDLFARAGFNCRVGTDQSFSESRLRAADLEALLSGAALSAMAERPVGFRWNQAVGRPPLMSRLNASSAALGAAIASKAEFDRSADRLAHEAEVVAMIGEVIQRPEFGYSDDATYTGHASALRAAAINVRDAARTQDHEAVRAAVVKVWRSCDVCHGDYRN